MINSPAINNLFKVFVYCGIIALISSCAQVVSPAGGPRDIEPPKVVKYIPDSAAVNFKSKEVNIFFNEYIQLKDLNSQLIISPPLKTMPDVEVTNKLLNIKFNDPLEQDVTYTINFGNAIRDLTEGNVAENFQYVFSTGSYIDSISFSGKIKNAFDLKTEKGILVMLYKNYADSIPYKSPPSYFSKTKDDGSFRINNITPGKYKAFVLKDADNNYLFNSTDELIGFSDTLINVFKSSSTNFSIFKEIPKQFLKKTYTSQYGKISFAFNKPVKDLQFDFLNEDKNNFLQEYSTNKDTVHLWYKGKEELLKIKITDENVALDTAEIKMLSKEKVLSDTRKAKPGLSVKLNASEQIPLNIGSKLIAEFSNPIKDADFTKIRLMMGIDTLKPGLAFIDSLHRKLAFSYSFIPDSTYKLMILPGAGKDIFGSVNDTVKVKFKIQKEKYYGSLKLDLDIPVIKKNYIVQLLDEKEKVVRENFVKGPSLINYELLPPGKYKLKIIYDDNLNNKWDTGNYLQKQQPEKVIYFATPLTVRSNWDMEEKWKVE